MANQTKKAGQDGFELPEIEYQPHTFPSLNENTPSTETLRNLATNDTTISLHDHQSDHSDDEDEDDFHHDGHRVSRREIRLSQRNSRILSAGNSARASLNRPASNVLRRLSLVHPADRDPASGKFTHPLSHLPTPEDFLVDFDSPEDPYRPMNWPMNKKIWTTLLYGILTMAATWASASYAAGTGQIAREFGVSGQVAILGTSLFLIGFGIGPLLWAPLSEVYGRRLAVLVPMFVAVCFTFGSAVAKDFQTLMITRFFGAFFASAPVTNTGGVLGDLFGPAERGIAMAGYAMAVVGAPVLGPIVSSALVAEPELGWRWTQYLAGIMQGVILLVCILCVDESYPPRLLVEKAQRLRIETGNWGLHAKFEEWDVSIGELASKFLIRPVQLLATPICLLMAIYSSFCYGILYMQLGSIPIIFGEERGWSRVVATLPFLSLLIGCILGCGINLYNQKTYNEAFRAAGNQSLPEKRLAPMMVGSVFFAGGQFVTGWTADPSIHWTVPCIGLIMQGTGFFTIFQSAMNYLVDTFTMYAASAVAANTFLRSCFACAFPLVVGPMYHNLGVGPGSSIPAGFAVLLIPVPFIFHVYGKSIRARSKWSRHTVQDLPQAKKGN
ncbi:major facilitator superfamily domain-containing protein [Cladorrhinum sp. PSN332]|nr:major facilitator superfamily domain-containing protein [Cladorrhinum sp. PSN332]